MNQRVEKFKLSDEVIIVGGGVIGVMSAYYLHKKGISVTVIDKSKIGAACSSGNCGYICPSHILPLTEPGMVMTGLKSLFNPKAAFRIKPQWRIGFYYWLMKFAVRCNHQKMMEAAHDLKAILDLSRSEYSDLFKETNLDAQWEENGLFYIFQTEKGIKNFSETDDLLQESFACKAEYYSGSELRAKDPALKEGLAGGYLYRDDASFKPDQFMVKLTLWLKREGVQFIEHCELLSINKSQGKIKSLHTSIGDMFADQYVFATGAWGRLWSKELEVTIPIEPAKGYSVTVERPTVCPSIPMLFPEHRVGITPFSDGFRLGSMMEFSGFDSRIQKTRITQLFNSAEPYLKSNIERSYSNTWTGWRPMTWDSLPIIGRLPKLANGILATGHNMLGMTLAPGTGRLIAELVNGEETEIAIQPYRVERF